VIMLDKADCFGQTDVGRVREVNEDQFLIASLSKSMQVHHTSLHLEDQTRLWGPAEGLLLLVADGMGGHAAGERASRLAVDRLTAYVLNTLPWFFRLRADHEDQLLDELKHALEVCQSTIEAEAKQIPERHGMGTTLTAAYVLWPRLYVIHVGDSRCYLFRRSHLRRITHDHTVAQQMAERGMLDDPEGSRWSHVLWNVVGGGCPELKPEVHRADLERGDTVLLCTDGLTRHVTDAEITGLLSVAEPSEATCRRLVDATNAGGGRDNVTVVLARFGDASPPAAIKTTTVEAASVSLTDTDTQLVSPPLPLTG
jgi:PPM family protein phosphatase